MSRYDDDNGFGGSLNRPGREAFDREEASWQAYSSQCEAITQSKLQAEIYTLKIENAELHMECDRLTNLLQWEQNRRDHIGTHGDDCWKWGPAHHECAMREIERLTAMLGPQKPMSAEEVTVPGFYWWRVNKYSKWKLFEVDYSVRLPGPIPPLRRYHGDDEFIAPLEGQFIGPIKMPEVHG